MMQRTSMLGALGILLMLGGGLAASDRASASQGQDHLMILSAIDDTGVVGEYAFEVVVVNQDDNPVEDAEVIAHLSMPSMTMDGAPYRVTLAPLGKGWYGGLGRLTMPGKWEVTIDARRSGQHATTQIICSAGRSCRTSSRSSPLNRRRVEPPGRARRKGKGVAVDPQDGA